MKRMLLFVALTATAFASCTRDEIIDLNQDEIGFSVVAENQTRAAAVYCANNMMTSFNVYGTYSDGTKTSWYINNDQITYSDGKWTNATTRYWTAGTHDFYAAVNGTMTINESAPAAPKIVEFSPETDVTKQLDLLYAVATGQTKATNDQVALNFRHALSQIEFRAKNTNAKLHVEITGVRVGQTPSKGTFTFPSESTGTQFEDHTQTGTHTHTTGTWTLVEPATNKTDYTVTFTAVTPGTDGEGLTISTDAADDTRNFTNSMLLLPTSSLTDNKTTVWDPTSSPTSFNGTYLAVKCKICNIAGTSYDASTDATLHNGWAVMPASFSWEPGKKYIYTFVFGEGNGGYEGGDNTDPTPDPDPVLKPITYTVTIDDFQNGGTLPEVDMDTK